MEFGRGMISPDVLKKIRHIELHTKRILRGCLVGDYRTSRKGFGLEFEQLSDYQCGDDIRYVDWKSSARMNKMLIKEYRDEQNRTVFLLVDGSSSTAFGSTQNTKKEVIAEIASVLALAAVFGKDHVGMIIFTDEAELIIPPSGGLNHAHIIMQEVFNFQPRRKHGTCADVAFKHLARIKRQESLVFVISDFIDESLEHGLRSAAKKNDIVAIRCIDQFEQQLPTVGFIHCQDLEDGEDMVIDTSSLSKSSWYSQRINDQNHMFNKHGVDYLDVVPGKPFIEQILLFLRKRL